MKRTALLSVFHKEGIAEFAAGLVSCGFTVYASGGTYKHLTDRGIEAKPVSDIVGGQAILGHRVVTLSRKIYAGLLARDTAEDRAELERIGAPWIDLVCVDLYPLQAEIKKEGSTPASVTEMTDIGGPTMIRAAAKGGRLVICDPADRQVVLARLKEGISCEDILRPLAAKAEFTVAQYALVSARYHSGGEYEGFFGRRAVTCKYGENAWQQPAHLYGSESDDPLALDVFEVVEGTDMSYNNYRDLDRLLQTGTHLAAVFHKDWEPRIALGVKHGNCCGAGVDTMQDAALTKMLEGDPLALFGGVVLMNFHLEEHLSALFGDQKLDCIVAPGFDQESIAMLRRKGNKCRFVVNKHLYELAQLDTSPRFSQVRGGFLLQPNYTFVPDLGNAVKYGEADRQMEWDMEMAWAIGSTSNSNTITIVKDGQLLGNGVGQQDRVGAAKLAVERAMRSGHNVQDAVAYSDSFFPFPDAPRVLIDAGVSAILTTSGSVRDDETIALCKERQVALYMMRDTEARGFFGH